MMLRMSFTASPVGTSSTLAHKIILCTKHQLPPQPALLVHKYTEYLSHVRTKSDSHGTSQFHGKVLEAIFWFFLDHHQALFKLVPNETDTGYSPWTFLFTNFVELSQNICTYPANSLSLPYQHYSKKSPVRDFTSTQMEQNSIKL